MGPILQSAFLKALGWSLIDSLWQMGIVWLIYLAITRSGKRFNANMRHNLALISLAAGSSWFMFSLIFNTFSGRQAIATGCCTLDVFITGVLPGYYGNSRFWKGT